MADRIVTTDHSDPDSRPEFSREIALIHLDAVEEQHERIVSISLAARAYQQTLIDAARSDVIDGLFGAILDVADNSQPINALRTMLETLPKEKVSHA